MKRIILFSDGTGNAAASIWRTNVWRMFEGIDLSGSDQVAFYDDGVGTSSFLPLALAGGAFGIGLKRNVIDIYKFVCRNYKSTADYGDVSEGDQIFAFGFSRGAFTIRTVVGLIANQGLVRYDSESDLDAKAHVAYREYRRAHFRTWPLTDWVYSFLRLVRKPFDSTHDPNERPVEKIEFLGLWDTVAAYGLPVAEMARGVSRYLYPLELPGRKLHEKVQRACHALSLDDERTTFHPVLWDESGQPPPGVDQWKTTDERITQIWFVGVHANVGGGYPDDSLACVPLTWIMQEAADRHLRFKSNPSQEPDALRRSRSAQDKDGRLYDSRSGLGGYYRYGPRNVEQLCNSVLDDPRDKVTIRLPKIHCSVIERIKLNAHLYAPIVLPLEYAVVNADRIIQKNPGAGYEQPKAATQRRNYQEQIWNAVWRRRVIYFLTVFASIYLVTYPLFWIVRPYLAASTKLRPVVDALDLLAAFLPLGAGRWVRAYSSNPLWFLEWVGIVYLLTKISGMLKTSIMDQMRAVWDKSLCNKGAPRILSLTEASRRWRMLTIITLVLSLWFALDSTGQLLLGPATVDWIRDNLPSSILRWLESNIPVSSKDVSSYIEAYTTRGMFLLFAAVAAALLIPDTAIQAVRVKPRYQKALFVTKIWIAPAFFALAFAYLIVALSNHFLFTVRDAFGAFCKPSQSAEYLDKKDKPSATLYFDIGSYQKAKDTGEIDKTFVGNPYCFGTGIKLERGVTYLFKIETSPGHEELAADQPGGKDNKQSTRIPRWTFFGNLSSTGGISMAGTRQAHPIGELPVTKRSIERQEKADKVIRDPKAREDAIKAHRASPGEQKVRDEMAQNGISDGFAGWRSWKSVVAVILYPFRRSLDRPWGSVIMRIGSEGNEENFIDPDAADKNELQSEDFKASRDGELFIYLNNPVSGLWGTELWPSAFITSTGIAKVTITKK